MPSKSEGEIRKLGVTLEALQDDVEKILEIMSLQQTSIKKIPKMSERIEKIENDVIAVKLATSGNIHDFKLLKIRTEKLEEIIDGIKDHEKRITQLEAV